MTPLYFTVGNSLQVMVLANVDGHVDGHPVLTYTYNIYRNRDFEDAGMVRQREKELLLDKKTDPNYMGYLTFEDPGKLFTYTADGREELSSDEVTEIIENISHYRDHPGLWQLEE
jgi:hypothetical protein